jgi:hypothetical protein
MMVFICSYTTDIFECILRAIVLEFRNLTELESTPCSFPLWSWMEALALFICSQKEMEHCKHDLFPKESSDCFGSLKSTGWNRADDEGSDLGEGGQKCFL